MKKRVFAFALTLIMTLGLTACGGKTTDSSSGDSVAAAKDSYTFKFADVVADNHPYNMGPVISRKIWKRPPKKPATM